MSKISYIHQGRPWLEKVLSASRRRLNLYTYGITSLQDDAKDFMESGKASIKPFDKKYRPNPFYYQYDLEIHIFLNYKKLTNREIRRSERRIKKLNLEDPRNPEIEKESERLETLRRKGCSGIPRYEHLFNAAEIRWPTTELPNGALEGAFVRDPWSIKRMKALSDERIFTIAFGGGGQGKTWTFLGFMLMIFEHFIYTRNGAKMSFSSINKDKINNVAWPHLQKLLSDTEKGISLYAGKSVVSGDWTLKRPGKGKSDTGGVFKGILVGRHLNDAIVIDKLTGTHGYEAYAYLIDEMQSTPQAPIKASSNYLMSGKPTWVIGAGNYDEDDDGLGPNVKPIKGGWDAVTPNTGRWISETITKAKATVIHFNNDLSPGMLSDEDAKRFWYLPNRTKKDSIYPPGTCNLKNKFARRFWFGWRSTDIDENRILTNSLVSDGQANLPLNLDPYPIFNFGSIDIADVGGDRNPFGHFQEGIEKDTKELVWGCKEIYRIDAPSDRRRNQDVISNEAVKIAKRVGISPDRGVIVDATKNTGHVGKFYTKGYDVVSMIYHKALPDGKRTDTFSRRVDSAILVNPNAPSDSGRYAHQICVNCITFGAYLLKEYITQGKVRGLNDDLLKNFETNRTLEEEMYRRSFLKEKITSQYGDRYCLDSKEDFVHSYKFSPDILDVWFQAAYYMFVIRGFQIYDRVEDEETEAKKERLDSYRDLIKDNLVSVHAGVWEDEDLDYLDENF